MHLRIYEVDVPIHDSTHPTGADRASSPASPTPRPRPCAARTRCTTPRSPQDPGRRPVRRHLRFGRRRDSARGRLESVSVTQSQGGVVVSGFLRTDDGLVGNQAGLSDAGPPAAAFRADDLGTQSEVGASLGKRCGVREFGEDAVGLGEQPQSPGGPRRPRSPETVTRPGKITNWDWSVSRKRHRPKIS